jgi:hypothetical protein
VGVVRHEGVGHPRQDNKPNFAESES